tara:strand:+ start:2874 stop:4706 length:1833 start_codon:yes stop_codon:yes gene_type:complete
LKYILAKIFILIFILSSSGQNELYLKKIDSIKKNVLANKIQDSIVYANANFNIGFLYRKSFIGDSAYYYYQKAEKIYRNRNADFNLAETLYGIAVIQKNGKDLIASELSSIEAITILENLSNKNEVIKLKSSLYNNLGLVFGELELFDESFKYYKESLSLTRQLEGDNQVNIIGILNNLALSYKKAREFNLALDIYSEILSTLDLEKKQPELFSLILNNYAHTKYLLKDYDELPDLYFKALEITTNPRGYNSIIINQYLAEYYYYFINDTYKAKYYAYRAKDIAEKYYNDELLSSLLLLSEVEEDEKASEYLKHYITLNDSLQKVERATRDKYARIRFETNQIEKENIKIARERMWLLIISIIILVTSVLLYVVINQRIKNKELKFIQEQQEANEEIYNLMLSQNESIEEARILEKKRISQELHDGVLGRLFGTRLNLDSLNMNTTTEAVKTRGKYIDELKTIEHDIRKVSHELNTDFVAGSGFIDLIETFVETQTEVYNLEYTLDYDEAISWGEVSNKTKIHIYRMVQEALHNIHKHANATLVNITFKLENNKIYLTLTDNGSGFDVNKAKSGIGLKNMNSRISEINGTIKITSEKNVGTTVAIEAPIP